MLEFAALHEYGIPSHAWLLSYSFISIKRLSQWSFRPSDFTSLRVFFASSFDSGEKVTNDGKEMYWEGVEMGKVENCIHLDYDD